MEVIVGHLVAPILAMLMSIIIIERLAAMAKAVVAFAHGADNAQ